MYGYWLIDNANRFRIPAENFTDAVNYGLWFWNRILTQSQREKRFDFFVCSGRSEHDDPNDLDVTTIDCKFDIKGYCGI